LILLVAAIQDIELHAEWLPSEDNAIADALSRHQYERLTVLCKQLGICPTLLRNSTHLRGYRKKLHSSFGMDLHPQQENHTSRPSTAMRPSPHSNEPESHIQHQLKRCQHGLQRRLSKPKQKQRRSTYKAFEVTTSTWDTMSPYSTTRGWKGLSEEENDIMVMSREGRDFPSREISSSASCSKFLAPMTELTSKQPCVLPLQVSYGQEKSHTTNGKNLHQTSLSHDLRFSSTEKTSFLPYQRQKPISSAKEYESQLPLHLPAAQHVPLPPFKTSLICSQPTPRLHCSREYSAPSPENISSERFDVPFLMQGSIQSASLVTPYGEAQRYQQLPQAFPETKSKCWEGGKAMQSTSTSKINLQKYFNTPDLYIPPPSHFLPRSLASSRPSPTSLHSSTIPATIWAV